MSYTFKYMSVQRQGMPVAMVPHLPVILQGHSGESIRAAALVDSGADTCAMPKSVADTLNLDLTKSPESTVAGASGFVKAKRVLVELMLPLPHERKRMRVPFNVIMNDFELPVILGRAGFFDNFVICFNEKERKFSLKPI